MHSWRDKALGTWNFHSRQVCGRRPGGLMLGTFRNTATGRHIKWFEFSYLKISRPNVPHSQVQFQDPVLSPRTIFPWKHTFLLTLLSPLVGCESPVPLGSWYRRCSSCVCWWLAFLPSPLRQWHTQNRFLNPPLRQRSTQVRNSRFNRKRVGPSISGGAHFSRQIYIFRIWPICSYLKKHLLWNLRPLEKDHRLNPDCK